MSGEAIPRDASIDAIAHQIDLFAATMQERFGARALDIAGRQAELADSEAIAARWRLLQDRLKRLSTA